MKLQETESRNSFERFSQKRIEFTTTYHHTDQRLNCFRIECQFTTSPVAEFNREVLYELRMSWKHGGQPHEATVVKMAPTRPLASRSFCPLVLLCDHRSLSNLQQRNTEAWYTLHQNYRPVSVLVFVQWSPKDSPRDDGRQICPK